jgi:choline kinase
VSFANQIGWQTAAQNSRSRQVFRFDYSNTSLILGIPIELDTVYAPVQLFADGVYINPANYDVTVSNNNTTIVINHNYQEMNTAGSFKLGSKFGGERVVSLDGDLLTTRSTLEEFLNSKDDLLGVTLVNSITPVFSKIVSNQVVDFSYEVKSNYEWTGLANLSRESSQDLGNAHMFQGLKKFLPLNFQEINCMEIDEVADIKRMEKWIVENF